MAISARDYPVRAMGSAISFVFSRILLFFAACWVGFLVSRLAVVGGWPEDWHGVGFLVSALLVWMAAHRGKFVITIQRPEVQCLPTISLPRYRIHTARGIWKRWTRTEPGSPQHPTWSVSPAVLTTQMMQFYSRRNRPRECSSGHLALPDTMTKAIRLA